MQIKQLSLAAGLYIVSTPIGHARDITLRALDILANADFIFCEDTRVTRKLMSIYGLSTPLKSYHNHNEQEAGKQILRALRIGKAVALVSDAGTPLISDPGYHIIRETAEAGHDIFPIPGASALLAALSVSGLPSDRFHFVGFLPPKPTALKKALAALPHDAGTVILFESPRRIEKLLAAMSAIFGDIDIVLARELTKKHETLYRSKISTLMAEPPPARGEYVVLFTPPTPPEMSLEALADDIKKRRAHESAKDIAQDLSAKHGLSKRALYQYILNVKDENA